MLNKYLRSFCVFILLTMVAQIAYSQTKYSGNVGGNPIHLYSYLYSDGETRAIYAYDKFDEPITINGVLKHHNMQLYEKNAAGNTTALITFPNFHKNADTLEGHWKSLKTGKKQRVSLTKDYTIGHGEALSWDKRELLERASLKNYYFKIVTSKQKRRFYADVIGIKIFKKGTDSLFQKIDVNCQLRWDYQITVNDYNFDGVMDFSVFEQSYAGPNTSSIYYLYDPKTNQFFDSGFEGTTLEFDQKRKRVYTRNQCCGGNSITSSIYKIVNNKMVLVEHHCIQWDEDKQKRVERPWKACH